MAELAEIPRTARPTAPGRSNPAEIGPVLYIAATLPKLSETFVYRELLALRERGVRVEAASVHAPEKRLGDPRLDELAAEVVHVYGAGKLRLLRDALRETASHPLRGGRTVALAIRDAIAGADLSPAKRGKVLVQAFAALALARRMRPRQISHIHAHMAHVPTTIAMYTARQLGIGFSFTGHANDIFPNRSLLREKLERAAFTACISHWHLEFYESVAKVPPAKLPIVRCGVDVPAPPSKQNQALRVVAVGRLVRKKGFDLLIEAAASVAQQNPGLKVQIIGEGPERSALQELARARGVEDVVEFAGPMPNADVLRAMERADVCVLPCRQEPGGDRDGIPVVLMEAMARGVCVISGDLPAIRELVAPDETGLLCAQGDAAALAVVLDAAVKNRSLRERLGRAGREHVMREFSTGVNIDRLMAALAAACKDARACAA